jgi:hypothetical protein
VISDTSRLLVFIYGPEHTSTQAVFRLRGKALPFGAPGALFNRGDRMKIMAAVLLLAGLLEAAPMPAHAGDASPLLGQWAVDVSKLPIPPAARPRSVTFHFSEAADGKWFTQVDIVDAGGHRTHSTSTVDLQGNPAPIVDSMEADTVALKLPAPNVLVMDLVKRGVPASTRVYVVSADGQSMIETASYAGGQGMPMMRTNYFHRVH